MSSMATRPLKPMQIRASARRHLYLNEWFKEKEVDDTIVAGRLNVTRQTVWKWRKEQWRLDVAKIAALAEALNILPEQLWRRPQEKSLDQMVANESPETKKKVEEMVSVLISKAS